MTPPDDWTEEDRAFAPCFPTMGDDSDWIEYQYGNENQLDEAGLPLFR